MAVKTRVGVNMAKKILKFRKRPRAEGTLLRIGYGDSWIRGLVGDVGGIVPLENPERSPLA